jgi:hypothetical protein
VSEQSGHAISGAAFLARPLSLVLLPAPLPPPPLLLLMLPGVTCAGSAAAPAATADAATANAAVGWLLLPLLGPRIDIGAMVSSSPPFHAETPGSNSTRGNPVRTQKEIRQAVV